MLSPASLMCLLALLGTLSHAAPTPLTPSAASVSAVTVTVRNSKGPGTLRLTFTETPASRMPAAYLAVLGGARAPEDKVVQVHSQAQGFPTGQPFTFHIHEAPVAASGNCSSTLAHWDPKKVHPKFHGGKPDDYKPVPGNWSTYELGDLSGKYHPLAANATLPLPNFEVRKREADGEQLVVVDPTLTKVADFAKLSVVMHDASGARVGCANFEVVVKEEDGESNLTDPGYGKKRKCHGKKKASGY